MAAALAREPEAERMDLPAEAEAYACADFGAVNQAFVERILELAGNRSEARVLDLGCGPADIPLRLIRVRELWRVTAVDSAGAMLDLARTAVERAGLTEHITLLRADAKATGLAVGGFDIIMSNSILHHVSDAGRFWREVRRLAGRSTLLLLRDLARPPTRAAARELVRCHAAEESELLQEEFYRSLLSAYTEMEVREQLREAGLTSLGVTRISDRHIEVSGILQRSSAGL